jgi:hypothetical protein
VESADEILTDCADDCCEATKSRGPAAPTSKNVTAHLALATTQPSTLNTYQQLMGSAPHFLSTLRSSGPPWLPTALVGSSRGLVSLQPGPIDSEVMLYRLDEWLGILPTIWASGENWWVLGHKESNGEFLDAAVFCRQLVPDSSVEAFLANHRRVLFPD